MKKLSALLMTLTLALALCACGGGDTASDPNLGRYDADQINIMGWSDFSSLFEGENYLELKANGKGSVKLAGESGSLKWTLDGENITITIEGVDSSGTLKDGVITLDDLFNMGCAATFVKEGATASSTDSNDSGSDSSTADDAFANVDLTSTTEQAVSTERATKEVLAEAYASMYGDDGWKKLTYEDAKDLIGMDCSVYYFDADKDKGVYVWNTEDGTGGLNLIFGNDGLLAMGGAWNLS